MNRLIYNAKIFTGNEYIQNGSLYLEGRYVKKIFESNQKDKNFNSSQLIDASGSLLFPALIDPHVHVRAFSKKYCFISAKEIVKKAIMGGYRAIGSMPNTTPIADSELFFSSEELKKTISESKYCKIIQYGATTIGLMGFHLTEIEKLKEKFGVYIFSNDGIPLNSYNLLNSLIELSSKLNIQLVFHCEDASIEKKYDINRNSFEKQAIAETIEIFKILSLTAQADYNHNIHICHISSKESVEVIENFKNKIKFTSEVTPHHLYYDEESIFKLPISTYLKCNPPIGKREDRSKLLDALIDGTIDMIATDHAPHPLEEKRKKWEEVRYGTIGLEWAFKMSLLSILRKLSLEEALPILYRAMVKKPGELLRIKNLEIKEGGIANFFIFKIDENNQNNKEERFFINAPGKIKNVFLEGDQIY